jgi:threonyl-tRNA synthetase
LSYAEEVAETLRQARGLRADVDRRSEKLGWKIREGETMKIPYLLVVGQREAESKGLFRCGSGIGATRASRPSKPSLTESSTPSTPAR